jgi:hypothetical protein
MNWMINLHLLIFIMHNILCQMAKFFMIFTSVSL